jgi:hypothetical protein
MSGDVEKTEKRGSARVSGASNRIGNPERRRRKKKQKNPRTPVAGKLDGIPTSDCAA